MDVSGRHILRTSTINFLFNCSYFYYHFIKCKEYSSYDSSRPCVDILNCEESMLRSIQLLVSSQVCIKWTDEIFQTSGNCIMGKCQIHESQALGMGQNDLRIAEVCPLETGICCDYIFTFICLWWIYFYQ